MKYILIAILTMTIGSTLFATITINEEEIRNIIQRFIISLIFSCVICLIIGIPICWIMYLLD